jgi:hypothetical protein
MPEKAFAAMAAIVTTTYAASIARCPLGRIDPKRR